MADFMINHISSGSRYFKDFWPNGEPTEDQVAKIYKRKPRAPYGEVTFRDGTSEKIWCTFDRE